MAKTALKVIAGLCALVSLCSVAGVYATWQYIPPHVDEASMEVGATMGEFTWAPEQILPEGDGTIAESQLLLVQDLVDKEGVGLNTADSYLNEQIDYRQGGGFLWSGRDTLGSMAVNQGNQLDKDFDLSEREMSFLIQFFDDNPNLYYIFTTSVDLGSNGNLNYPIGSYIYPIYRTEVVYETAVNEETGETETKWWARTCDEGYAVSAYYEESRWDANRTKIPAWNPDTWQKGEPPM